MRQVSALVIALVVVSCAPNVTQQQTVPSAQMFRVYLPILEKPGIGCDGNLKRGLAHTWGKCEDVAAACATWQYQWYPAPYDCDADNVPMIRDAEQWDQVKAGALTISDNQWLMGFNEPDSTEQSGITPSQAATLWREIEARYPDRLLASPAPSQSNPKWIMQFREAYIAQYGRTPRLDALAMHFYGQRAADGIALTEWYKERAREWGITQVWVTEFAILACTNLSLDDAGIEVRKLIDYFDNDTMIARYAWFTNRTRADESYVNVNCMTALFDWATGIPMFWRDTYVR